jgi:hypothetical protein
MSTSEVARCSDCDREIEFCFFCDEPGCEHALCYRCVTLALREEVAEPHGHGG